MEKEFKPLFGGKAPDPDREFKPLFEVKPKAEFGPYIEADINTLVLVLEKNEKGVFEAQGLKNLKEDLFDTCKEKGEVLDVVFSYLLENVDDPEEFLKENDILE